MKTKTFLYARVSTEEQKRDGYSLPKQVKKLKAYAEKAGLTIDLVIEEDDSAKEGKTRKKHNRMLQEILASNDQHSIILCEKVDRLQRNLEDAQNIDELVKTGKLTVRFSDESPHVYDKSANSHTKLMMNIKTVIAKFYIDLLREESMKGVDEKVEQGGYHSVAPPGYWNNKILKIIEVDDEVIGTKEETRAELMQEAFKLYATGRYDVRTLSKELSSRGLTNRNGNLIGKSRIAEHLKTPLYYGMVRHPRTRKLIKGIHTPLISKELFDKCEDVRKGKTSFKLNRKKFAFQDVIKCGYCGCSIIGETKPKKIKSTGETRYYTYYHCTKGSPKFGKACPQPWWTEKELEELFFIWFDNVYIDDEILDIIREAIDQGYKEDQKYLDAQKKRLNDEYRQNEKEMRTLYKDKNAKVIDLDFFQSEYGILRERQEEIRDEITAIDEYNEDFMENALRTIELCNSLNIQYLSSDIEGKNKILKMLYRTVVLTDEGDGFKFPFFDLAWKKDWDTLYRLRQVELGGENNTEMKKWLLG